MKVAEFFIVMGFGSALLLTWFLLANVLVVDLWTSVLAYIFFLLLGFGGVVANFIPEQYDEGEGKGT